VLLPGVSSARSLELSLALFPELLLALVPELPLRRLLEPLLGLALALSLALSLWSALQRTRPDQRTPAQQQQANSEVQEGRRTSNAIFARR
jgi:hypothetical protein